LYQQAYVTKDAPSLTDFKQGEMLYSRRASGSGNKRNGLAWTLVPEPIIPDTVVRLVGQIQSLLAEPVEPVTAEAKDTSTAESETGLPGELPAVREQGNHPQDEGSEAVEGEAQNTTDFEVPLPSKPPAVVEPPKEPTEKTNREQLTLARVGQGLFRERLEAIEPGCRLTGLTIKAHLRASHIKPWRDSSDAERLDGNNGLLLSPHVDHLFDQGFITFLDDGTVLVSPSLERNVLAAWHIDLHKYIRPLNATQRSYMVYHRSSIFRAG
jgi:hypothetical protein